MVTKSNSIGIKYSISLANHNARRAKLTQAALTGLKQDITVVDTILGNKARSTTNLGRKIITGMGTGSNIISTSIATLNSVRDRLNGVKGNIISLEKASPEMLTIAQSNYQKEMENIHDTLANTRFAGKNLFDGTLASLGNAATVSAESLPATSEPLRIQTGIDPSDTINISIPKLLPGDGSVADVSVAGRFEPLFPNISLGVTYSSSPSNTNTYYLECVTAVARIRAAINAPGVNTLDDIARVLPTDFRPKMSSLANIINYTILQSKDIANSETTNTIITGTVGCINAAVDSMGEALLYTFNTLIPTIPITPVEIATAKNNIKSAYNAINTTVGNVRAAARDTDLLTLIPIGANSLLTSVYKSLNIVAKVTARSMFDINGNGDSNAAGTRCKNAIIASLDTALETINSTTSVRSTTIIKSSVGNIETPIGRAKVDISLDNAIATLDQIILNLTRQQNALTIAKSNLETIVVQSNAAANNYLNVDYEKIVFELIELLRKDKSSTLAFALSEKTINLVISQMETINVQ